MPLQLKPLHPVFVAEASGIDLTQPLAPADVRAINAAMNEHAVLVWRGQPLTPQQQINVATAFSDANVSYLRSVLSPRETEWDAPRDSAMSNE